MPKWYSLLSTLLHSYTPNLLYGFCLLLKIVDSSSWGADFFSWEADIFPWGGVLFSWGGVLFLCDEPRFSDKSPAFLWFLSLAIGE